jgi:hypothetical protein
MPLEQVNGLAGYRGVANGERREARNEDAKTLRHTVALAQVREPSGWPSEPPDNQNPEVSSESIAFWPVGFHMPIVQAQRREAWGEPTTDTAPSVVCPRPHGRSAFMYRALEREEHV